MSGLAKPRVRWVLVAGVAVLGFALAGCSGSTGVAAGSGDGSGKAAVNQPVTQPSSSPAVVLPATLTSSVSTAADAVPVDTAVA